MSYIRLCASACVQSVRGGRVKLLGIVPPESEFNNELKGMHIRSSTNALMKRASCA